MTQVDVAFECDECTGTFDEMDDGVVCSVCGNMICEECQPIHATDHCFIKCDAIKEPEKKEKSK